MTYRTITLDGRYWLTDGQTLLADVTTLGDLIHACHELLSLAGHSELDGSGLASFRYALAAWRGEGAL